MVPADHSDPIDRAHLAEQAAGDLELQAELLSLFSRQAREIVERVAAPPGHGVDELPDRTTLLHTLSGSARAVGAWRVAARAQRLEEEVRRKGLLAIDVSSLADSVAEACAAIDRGADPPRPA